MLSVCKCVCFCERSSAVGGLSHRSSVAERELVFQSFLSPYRQTRHVYIYVFIFNCILLHSLGLMSHWLPHSFSLQKHCERQKSSLRIRFRPSLFQHVGLHSSLAGKIQKLTVTFISWVCVPVAQWLEHCVSSAKVVGSIPREHTYWQYKCIAWMHCKSLWIKASAKCINVNVVYTCYKPLF